jgi:hypothetical protein
MIRIVTPPARLGSRSCRARRELATPCSCRLTTETRESESDPGLSRLVTTAAASVRVTEPGTSRRGTKSRGWYAPESGMAHWQPQPPPSLRLNRPGASRSRWPGTLRVSVTVRARPVGPDSCVPVTATWAGGTRHNKEILFHVRTNVRTSRYHDHARSGWTRRIPGNSFG